MAGRHLDRREMLKEMTALGAAALAGELGTASASAQDQASGSDRFFPNFKAFNIQTSGAIINGVVGGQGPPLLLLHGAPQTHISWRLAAPKLAADYTVIASDLRGYGDSSKPPDGDNHSNYSKRAMALDQVEVMRHFGFEKFPVIGHDRGGRVAHRMALDHADKVQKVAVLDIVPTYYLYTHVTIEFVLGLQLVLGPGRGAQVVEPVKVRLHEFDRHMRVEIVRRHDVQHGEMRDLVGVIERHAVSHAPAAVVPDNRKPIEAVVLHDFDHVERHRPLRVVGVVVAVGRFAAVTVATEVGHDHRVVLGELGRDDVPGHVGLRRAVDEQQRRAVATAYHVDGGARRLNLVVFESGREEVQRIGLGLRGNPRVGRRSACRHRGPGGGSLQHLAAIEVC